MAKAQSRKQDPNILQVFIFKEGRFFGSECFVQSQIVMGRSPDVDLMLDDDITSRTHASVELQSDGIVLEDLASSNGTFVNGEPVERCYISARDEVSIGSFTLKFKQLARTSKNSGFVQETRLVDHSSHDAVRSSRKAPSPEMVSDHQARVASALADELGRDEFNGAPRAASADAYGEARQGRRQNAQWFGSQDEDFGPGLDDLLGPSSSPAPAKRKARSHDSEMIFDYEEDQEEYELKYFVEPFSLLNNLIRENFAQPKVPTFSHQVMEVIGYTSEKHVTSYAQLERGKKHRSFQNDIMVHFRDRESGRLFFTDEYSGGIISDGVTIPLEDLKDSRYLFARRRGAAVYSYRLRKGDYANVIHPGGGSFVRFVNPPKIPFPRSHYRINPTDIKIFSSSFITVVFCIILIGTFYKGNEAVANQDLDMFAKIDIKDIQMEKPEEEVEIPLDQLPQPEPEPEQEAKPEPEPEPKPKPKPKKRERKRKPPKRQRSRKAARQAAASAPSDSNDAGGDPGAGAGMMAALGNLNQKKPSQNIVAAVSNLDAVRVPGGRSRYKVSGLVTKLPTSSVVTARGRGLGIKGGIELLRGGKGRGTVGALGGGKTGKRSVGGVVFNAPKRKMRVQGTLSREAIAAVVRQHLRQIQYCYEKNLMLNPNLTGKLMMEWTISTSGSVTVVKTKQNTMATPAVAMCVSSNIKGWRFPQPKGGIVVVSYPFIFNSIGF